MNVLLVMCKGLDLPGRDTRRALSGSHILRGPYKSYDMNLCRVRLYLQSEAQVLNITA